MDPRRTRRVDAVAADMTEFATAETVGVDRLEFPETGVAEFGGAGAALVEDAFSLDGEPFGGLAALPSPFCFRFVGFIFSLMTLKTNNALLFVHSRINEFDK